MGLPSPHVVSNNFQQWALVIWNMFPLLVIILFEFFLAMQNLGSTTHDHCQAPSARNSKRNRQDKKAYTFDWKYFRAIRIVSILTLSISCAIHIAIISISVTATLFPAIFAREYRQEFRISSLFIPPVLLDQGNTVGDGVRSFFLWDQVAGFSTILLVALIQLRNLVRVVNKQFSWVMAVGATILGSCVVGPGSMCMMIHWFYDETLFGGEGEGKVDEW